MNRLEIVLFYKQLFNNAQNEHIASCVELYGQLSFFDNMVD